MQDTFKFKKNKEKNILLSKLLINQQRKIKNKKKIKKLVVRSKNNIHRKRTNGKS